MPTGRPEPFDKAQDRPFDWLRTGLSKAAPRIVRQAHHERNENITACITYAMFKNKPLKGQRPRTMRGLNGSKLLKLVESIVAGPTGLEPATSGVTGRRSIRLNYDPVEDVLLVGEGGVEPPTPCL